LKRTKGFTDHVYRGTADQNSKQKKAANNAAPQPGQKMSRLFFIGMCNLFSLFSVYIDEEPQRKGGHAMDDLKIIDLYWARSEDAVTETAKKYGPYCRSIAGGILKNREDREECVSDVYFKAWNTIPPHRPQRLRLFLGKITRTLALTKLEKLTALKRGGGDIPLVFEELETGVPAESDTERIIDDMELSRVLNEFIAGLPLDARRIFLRRYWYFSGIKEIARDLSFTESKVKTTLLRTRNALREFLEKEGITL